MEYVQYLMENPRSFLVKIFGLYKIRVNDFEPRFIMLMEMLDCVHEDLVECRYDVKVFDRKGESISFLDLDSLKTQINSFDEMEHHLQIQGIDGSSSSSHLTANEELEIKSTLNKKQIT